MFLCTKRQIPNNIALPICSEQLFQGLISPRAFTELLRLARPGGVIAWNIATGYEAYGPDYERYDEIVMGLVRDRRGEFLKPVKVSTYRVIKKNRDLKKQGHNYSEIPEREKLVCFGKFNLNAAG